MTAPQSQRRPLLRGRRRAGRKEGGEAREEGQSWEEGREGPLSTSRGPGLSCSAWGSWWTCFTEGETGSESGGSRSHV